MRWFVFSLLAAGCTARTFEYAPADGGAEADAVPAIDAPSPDAAEPAVDAGPDAYVNCGDGFMDPGEQCDTMGDSAACDGDCTLPVCGDGHRNMAAAELCDDGNDLPCGSCNATCTALIPLAAATGLLHNDGSVSFTDGETMILNDGINAPTVFEFDTLGNGVAPGRVLINATGGGPSAMANQIQNTIDAVGATLRIDAIDTGGGDVDLTHDLPGGFGNQPIGETVTNATFMVMGMSGGSGADCPAGTGCTAADPNVCAPPTTCVAGACM